MRIEAGLIRWMSECARVSGVRERSTTRLEGEVEVSDVNGIENNAVLIRAQSVPFAGDGQLNVSPTAAARGDK